MNLVTTISIKIETRFSGCLITTLIIIKQQRRHLILATTLKEEFPQVEKAVRTRNLRGFKLKLKDEYINVQQALATDSEVFDIFSISMIGSSLSKDLLDDQDAIVLSKDLAEKIFNDNDPIGKEIVGLINNEDHVFI